MCVPVYVSRGREGLLYLTVEGYMSFLFRVISVNQWPCALLSSFLSYIFLMTSAFGKIVCTVRREGERGRDGEGPK